MEQPTPSDQERTWAALAHLAPLVGYFVLIGQILVPLAILLFGPKTPFVQAHAKESLNGQITYTLYGLGLFLLALTVVGIVLALPSWFWSFGTWSRGPWRRGGARCTATSLSSGWCPSLEDHHRQGVAPLVA